MTTDTHVQEISQPGTESHDVGAASQIPKTLNWWDGWIVVGFAAAGFIYASFGPTVAAIGAAAALAVWGGSAIIGWLQAEIISELAAMFPEKSGGIGIYASLGLNRYSPYLGTIATFGYWFAWSSAISVNALLVGDYMHSLWFSAVDARIIGSCMIFLVWSLNIFGIRPGVWAGYLLGFTTLVPEAIMIVVGLVSGKIDLARLGQLRLANGDPWLSWGAFVAMATWFFIAGWSAYGTEVAATLAPEFKQTKSSAPKALRWSGATVTIFYVLVGLVLVTVVPSKTIVSNPYTAFAPLLKILLGSGWGTLVIISVIASMILASDVATIDGSRALYQLSLDKMTIRWLGKLNGHGIPARAMTVDLVLNLILVWTLGTPLFILAAGNLGYILAFIMVLASFLLLRRSQPQLFRPIRRSRIWLPIAGILMVLNVVFLLIGAPSYGWVSVGFGIVVLVVSVALYKYRRLEQRRASALPMEKV